MNTLRTFIVFAILSAVGYGVYATLTHQPPPPPPEIAGHEWSEAPNVELPGGPSGMPPVGVAATGEGVPGLSFAAAPAEQPIPLDAGPAQQPPSNLDSVAQADAYPPAPAFAGDPSAIAPVMDPSVGDPNVAAGQPFDPGAPPAGGFDAAPPAGEAPPFPVPAVPPTGADPAASSAPPAVDRYGQPLAPESPAAVGAAPVAADAYASATTPLPPEQPAAAAGAASFDAVMWQIQAQLDQGRLADAHLELSRGYRSPQFTPAQQAQVHDLLNRLAGTVVYSQESLLEPPYEVQPGDNLERIGKVYEVPWQLLAKINGIADPQQVQPGQTLKVVRGPFHATVELQSYTMTVWLGERYAGSFPIGIGRDAATPEGTFQVLGKQENPTYHGSDVVIDANDPNNPLGERWIDLGNHIGI
ncbi:MAG: LysM peptidoglycan-binding domain-containing protein, partial [Planctomycetaceae bacterium]|nr:LysM peptidoglycan-binding domain-containing protein [Planctomycetaceae bacterium]